jgi:hypothetical protein
VGKKELRDKEPTRKTALKRALDIITLKRFLTIGLTFLILVHTAASSVAGQAKASTPTESQVKVAMIYNLAKFIEWPESILPNTAGTLQICYLGDSSLAGNIKQLQNKTVKNRTLVVKQVNRIEDVGSCQILIVGEEFRDRLSLITGSKRFQGVFTISDIEDFAVIGGMVQFYLKNGKIRFKINHAAFKKADLVVSAQVLKLATDVIE